MISTAGHFSIHKLQYKVLIGLDSGFIMNSLIELRSLKLNKDIDSTTFHAYFLVEPST